MAKLDGNMIVVPPDVRTHDLFPFMPYNLAIEVVVIATLQNLGLLPYSHDIRYSL